MYMSADQIKAILKKLDAIESNSVRNREMITAMEGQFTQHRKMACEHWKANVAFQDELRPILEAQRTIVYFHKFLQWGGLTLFAFIVGFYLFFKRIL